LLGAKSNEVAKYEPRNASAKRPSNGRMLTATVELGANKVTVAVA
jgi:hypothetical protein